MECLQVTTLSIKFLAKYDSNDQNNKKKTIENLQKLKNEENEQKKKNTRNMFSHEISIHNSKIHLPFHPAHYKVVNDYKNALGLPRGSF
jgi:hypothetical protein